MLFNVRSSFLFAKCAYFFFIFNILVPLPVLMASQFTAVSYKGQTIINSSNKCSKHYYNAARVQ